MPRAWFRHITVVVVIGMAFIPVARAQSFPFGLEMTLDVAPMPGSKRIPTLEIGDDGEVLVELWCKGGKGRISIAGDSVVFIPGVIADRGCPPAKVEADDALLSALTNATNWSRQGDFITFSGAQPLRFRLNTN